MSNSEITIRAAREDDLTAIVACVRSAYSVYLERLNVSPAPLSADYAALLARGVIYVLTEHDKVHGILVMFPRDAHMFIENIAVDPRHQGRGLGKALMAFAEEQTRSSQLNEMRLYTHERMTENLRLYHSLGFEETDRHIEDQYHRVFLHKILV
ncbi:GNAT family N-acetyltransferase [Ktedonospora formicarum]|uniref:Acetyltransferase n=1 Tax=Ktedonospora formicarum TaxID=2778364 RepID=A0A8J3I4S4_9CHLR|nr:GNAT family N-acetyltransferase [Ktedonospora formicarum]GHO49484.1 acetyltransferase [Ktedonospora formicarum]